MKLISLNTWGARGGIEKLLDFFQQHADVDIFCLQEIWNGGQEMVGKTAGGTVLDGVETDLLNKIAGVLPEHIGYFRPRFYDYYGLALFVRKSIPLEREGDVFVYKEHGWISDEEPGNHAANLQFAQIQTNDGARNIVNFHGFWNGKGKGDTEERIQQSKNILSFLSEKELPTILIGDLNLLPETKSLALFEEAGMRNLIKEYGITSTRTSFYTREQKYADYAFVSPEISLLDFKVLPDEVSDHSPLYLEFK